MSTECPFRPCCTLNKMSHPTEGLICVNYGKGCSFYVNEQKAQELSLKPGLNEKPRESLRMLDKAKILEWLEAEPMDWVQSGQLAQFIRNGTFDAPLTEQVRQLREQVRQLREQVRQLREQLEDVKWSSAWSSAWYEAHVEDAGRSANYWQSHYTKAIEGRDKLVKALEHYAEWIDWEDDSMGDVARNVLSEIKGQGEETNE